MTPIRRRVLTVAAAVLALTNLGAVPVAAAECSANAAYQLICTIKDGPIVCVTEPCP